MAKHYGKLPSELIGCEDEYTAFCFDEACAFISSKLEQNEKPNFKQIKTEKQMNKIKNSHYSSPSELYRAIEQMK